MKITRVGQYGLQLTRFSFVNCYLVREDDGYTLIDAGLRGSEAAILKAAGNIPIKRRLLNHAHMDHVGSADALVACIPEIILGASGRSIRILKKPPDLSLLPAETGPIRGYPQGIRSQVSLVIKEGDRIGSLLAIDTPGHIHGQVAFLDERDGTLYGGDTFLCFSYLAIPGWTPWYLRLKVNSNLAQAKESAIKLLNYPIERFACGHGKVRSGGKPALEDAIALTKL